MKGVNVGGRIWFCWGFLGNLFMALQSYHPYHLVDPSPWPLMGSCGVLIFTVGGVFYLHYSNNGLLLSGLLIIIVTMVLW
jgi:hypothetical protein